MPTHSSAVKVFGMIEQVNGKQPRIAPDAYVAPGAVVVGDVELGSQASVWFGAVLRGDINWIRVGARSNIQDQAVLHVHYTGQGVDLGCEVVVGHRAVIHSATIEDRALIGIGAIVLDGARVGEQAVVAAGSVVPPGAVIPPRTMAMGTPAKARRELTPEELAANLAIVDRYIRVSRCHRDLEHVEDFSHG